MTDVERRILRLERIAHASHKHADDIANGIRQCDCSMEAKEEHPKHERACVEEFENQIKRLKIFASCGDHASARNLEADLYEQALHAIVNDEAYAVEIAKLVLTTNKIVFPRRCR